LRTHTLAAALTIFLALIVLGGYVVATSQAVIAKVSVFYLPYRVDLSRPPKWGIYAIIVPPRGHKPGDINPDTILLENTLAPTSTSSSRIWFTAKFDPHAVIDIILAKITYHDFVYQGKYTISLEISGEFKDGTPFEGTGKIVATISEWPSPSWN